MRDPKMWIWSSLSLLIVISGTWLMSTGIAGCASTMQEESSTTLRPSTSSLPSTSTSAVTATSRASTTSVTPTTTSTTLGDWTILGGRDFGQIDQVGLMLAVDRSNGNPYVAYVGNYGSGIKVEKYAGGSWQAVGSSFGERPNSLAVSQNRVPYVAFLWINSAVFVSSYNLSSASWEGVGTTVSSPGAVAASLAVDSVADTDVPFA